MLKDVTHSNLHSISWFYFEKALYVQLEHHNGGSTGYTSNFLNSVLEGNISQVVVINNELPNPIQLNIETLSRHEIKCTCKFILSVVSWKVKLLSKAKRLRDKIDISQCALLNMTVKVITALETSFTFLSIHTCLPIKYWIPMQ